MLLLMCLFTEPIEKGYYTVNPTNGAYSVFCASLASGGFMQTEFRPNPSQPFLSLGYRVIQLID